MVCGVRCGLFPICLSHKTLTIFITKIPLSLTEVTYNLNDISCMLSHRIIFERRNFKEQPHK